MVLPFGGYFIYCLCSGVCYRAVMSKTRETNESCWSVTLVSCQLGPLYKPVQSVKELHGHHHGWRRILKKLAIFFQVRHTQSVLIFSILNHPCSCLFFYYLFGVFLPFKLLFWGFLRFEGDFALRINDLKYRDIASKSVLLNIFKLKET